MRKLFICFLFFPFSLLAQKSEQKDSIVLSEQVKKTLSEFNAQITKIQEAQSLYVKGLFEGKGFDVDKVKDIKIENGKFIFKTEK